MKQFLTITFCLSFFTLSTLVAQDAKLPYKDSILSQMSSLGIPAVGIGLISDGKISEIQTLGNFRSQAPISESTWFEVASITKSISTMSTLRLVQNGDWDMDEPLYHYWIDPEVADDTLHQLLSTRHVLSHQTGFVNWRWMHESGKLTFDHPPGTQFGYSGEGFEYLRKALEAKFQTSFQQLVDSLIFDPLDMQASTLIWQDKIDSNLVAIPHKALGEAYPYKKREVAFASDGMLTTVEDLCQFGIYTMNKIQSGAKAYEDMIRPQSQAKPGVNFGLGWIVFEDLANDEYALLNAGSNPGVNAILLLFPKTKEGLVVMTNSDQGRVLVMQMIGKVFGQKGGEILSRL